MINGKIWLKVISVSIIILLVFSCLCTGEQTSRKGEEEKDIPDVDLEILYLGQSYLLPTPPGPGVKNKTEISAQQQISFSHNIRDRKFNEDLKPELNIWVKSQGKSGMKLEFEIYFQMVEDATVKPNKKYKIIFGNYTTSGLSEFENITLPYLSYKGKPFDIKYGSENWCSVTLIITRTDNETKEKLHIYLGADEKVSFIKIPYDITLSAFEHENKEKKDDKNTPGFEFGLIIVTLLIITLKYYWHNPNKRT